jgi:hypothetical protein
MIASFSKTGNKSDSRWGIKDSLDSRLLEGKRKEGMEGSKDRRDMGRKVLDKSKSKVCTKINCILQYSIL